MKKTLLLALLSAFCLSLSAQTLPTINDNSLLEFYGNNDSWRANALAFKTYMAAGGGTVTSVSALGTGLTVANPSTTPLIGGTLNATSGGTGISGYAIGDILTAASPTTLATINAVALGNVLLSGGTGTIPGYGKVGLSTHVTGTLPVGNGGTGVTGIGGDVTIFGSNGAVNIYYAPTISNTSAVIGYSRSGTNMVLNMPDADASFRGTVSTTTQTFAGNKNFSGTVSGSSTGTFAGLLSGNAGVTGAATASVAAVNAAGVADADFAVITSSTTLDQTNNYVTVGTLSAAITISLPACNSTRDGWEYRILKTGTDNYATILDPNAAETFTDGASTKSLYSQGNSATCKCRSSNNTWFFQN